jgi:hypothetical protein
LIYLELSERKKVIYSFVSHMLSSRVYWHIYTKIEGTKRKQSIEKERNAPHPHPFLLVSRRY